MLTWTQESPETRRWQINHPQPASPSWNQRGSTQLRPRTRRGTAATGRTLPPLRQDTHRRFETSSTPSPKKPPKDDKSGIKKDDKTPPSNDKNTRPNNSSNIKTESSPRPSQSTPNAFTTTTTTPTAIYTTNTNINDAAIHNIPDTTPFTPQRTAQQLAATRRAQRPQRQAFLADHPGAWLRVPTSGVGALCAWRAIEASWNAAIPRIARTIRIPEATLRGQGGGGEQGQRPGAGGLVTLATLEAERVRDQQRPDTALLGAGIGGGGGGGGGGMRNNFTADYAARIFGRVVWQQLGIPMDLGFIGPLQRMAFGGNNNDLSYMVLGGGGGGGPTDGAAAAAAAPAPQAICRIWIWNNNEPGAGHYEGIRDA